MENAAFKAIIYGVVQGVGFRFFTARKAEVFGVNGYVKNLRDGNVEVYAEGDKKTLEQFLQELKKGPYGATVDNIDTEWKTPANQYKDFRITY